MPGTEVKIAMLETVVTQLRIDQDNLQMQVNKQATEFATLKHYLQMILVIALTLAGKDAMQLIGLFGK